MSNPGKQLALNFSREKSNGNTKPVDLRHLSSPINSLSISNISCIGSFENMQELQVLRLHYSKVRFSGYPHRQLPNCHTMSLINCYQGVRLISPSIRHLTILNGHNFMNLCLSDIESLPELDTLVVTLSRYAFMGSEYFDLKIPHVTIYSMQCAQKCREKIRNIAPMTIVPSSKRNIQGMIDVGV